MLSGEPHVREARPRDPVLPPTMHSRGGSFGDARDSTGAAKRVDQFGRWGFHNPLDAIIGSSLQAESCDNRDCDSRKGVANGFMPDAPALRPEVSDVFERLDALGLTQKQLADELGLEQNKISKARSGERQFKATELIAAREWLAKHELTAESAPDHKPIAPKRRNDLSEQIDMVGIQHADLAFGMGATFTDDHVDVQVLNFPKVWVETITYSPPALLSWVRGRGDSMTPTIYDGDLILLDRSQKVVREQDAIWAFAVGDVGSIKRLRVKGDRYVILSDNPTVPDDEEPQDFVTIVGRVVFVGAKK